MDHLFKDFVELYSAVNKSEWLTVFEENEIKNYENDIFTFCAMINATDEEIKEYLSKYDWGFSQKSFGKETFNQYGDDEAVYISGERKDEFEYLVALRYFDKYPTAYEISPKSIWYGNLRHTGDEYRHPKTDEVMIRAKTHQVEVRTSYLKDFLKANTSYTDGCQQTRKLDNSFARYCKGIYNETIGGIAFLKLSDADLEIYKSFVLPTNLSIPEYQQFLMKICKLTAESINTKLFKRILEKQYDGSKGSIAQLDDFLKYIGIDSEGLVYSAIKKPYDSRNKLAGHRASMKEYNKVWKRSADCEVNTINDAKMFLCPNRSMTVLGFTPFSANIIPWVGRKQCEGKSGFPISKGMTLAQYLKVSGVRSSPIFIIQHQMNREIAVDILSAYGFAADCAENGEIARNLFEKSKLGTHAAILIVNSSKKLHPKII